MIIELVFIALTSFPAKW